MGRLRARILEEVGVAAALGLAAAGKTSAGGIAGVFIDAKLEAQGVDGLNHALDPLRESLRVSLEVAGGIAVLLHPAVVDGDGVVTGGGQATIDESMRIVENCARRKAALIMRPVVPAHGGDESERRSLRRGRGKRRSGDGTSKDRQCRH